MMQTVFLIDEEEHSWGISNHNSFDEALAELNRIATLPWGEEPNFPNCGQAQCTCRFDIVEFDVSSAKSSREVNRTPALRSSAAGLVWLIEVPSAVSQ